MEVTKEEFLAYEKVRKSGVTNMFDTVVVEELSGLNEEQQIEIMDGYTGLVMKYLRGGENEF